MSQKKTIDRTMLVAGVVGSLVLLYVIGVKLFGRLDLTADRQFTLGQATRDTLDGLKDPVTVRAYFSADLPPPYSTNARYVKDLLDEYYAKAHGNFRYEFIDPAAEESDADKEKKKDVKRDIFGRPVREATAIERELQALGIPSLEVRVNEADKLEVKRAYMGLAIQFGDKKEVIPLVKETSGLEYDLTTLLRKLTRTKTPKVALVGGHEGPGTDKDLARAWQLLGQAYTTTQVDLTTQPEIPADVDALLVVGPKTPFSDAEKRALGKFVASGKGAAFLVDAIRTDSTLQVTEMSPGLGDLLAAWGVTVKPGLVLDQQCATINVAQQRGAMRITQSIPYPFIPMPRSLDPHHPLTRGLGSVGFPFMSPLEVAASDGNVKRDVLVRSSPRSAVQEPPYNLDPLQRWTQDSFKDQGAKDLIVTLSGQLPGFAGGAPAQNARVLVAGGSAFMTDPFLTPGNEALVMNLVDWLVLDEAMLSVRSRGLGAAPLADVGEGARATVKYLNIVGVPALLVAFGLVRWRLREKRRTEVSV